MHDEPIILVGGSKINSPLLKKIYKKHKIYAADSGANFLLSNEMDFEAVIGAVSYTHLTLPTICSV